MTHGIHLAASRVGEVEKFQYYISRNVLLTRKLDDDIEGSIDENGKMKITQNTDIIQITSNTKGVLIKKTIMPNGYYEYNVCFGADDSKFLCFQYEKKYDKAYLVLQKIAGDYYVKYGNHLYRVEWDPDQLGEKKAQAKSDEFWSKFSGWWNGITYDGESDPYLLVKMNVKIKQKEKYQKETGRSVK